MPQDFTKIPRTRRTAENPTPTPPDPHDPRPITIPNTCVENRYSPPLLDPPPPHPHLFHAFVLPPKKIKKIAPGSANRRTRTPLISNLAHQP